MEEEERAQEQEQRAALQGPVMMAGRSPAPEKESDKDKDVDA